MELNAFAVAIVMVPVLAVEAAVMLRRRAGFAKMAGVFALTAYFGIVAAVTLFPLPLCMVPGQVPIGAEVNIVPFASIVEAFSQGDAPSWLVASLATIYLGNAAMLAPEGFLLPILFPKLRSACKVLAIVLATTVGIELLQLVIGLHVGYLYRVVDIDDVILNFAGGAIGYAVARLVFGLNSKWTRQAT